MKVILCGGRFGGTYVSYDKFKNDFFIPILSKFFSEDTSIFLYNHHDPVAPVTSEKFTEICGSHIAKTKKNNEKKVFIVNWGWHSSTGEYTDFDGYARPLGICTSPAVAFKEEHRLEGEYVVKNKNGLPVSTIYSDPSGYTVIYFLWDAFHLVNEGSKNELEREFLAMAVNVHRDIFQKKYHEIIGDDEAEKLPFISVYDKALESIGGVDKIPEIVDEMISVAPVKELVLAINQLLKCYNTERFNRTNKPLYVDNKMVKTWLRGWAESKWPYFILFGHALSIKNSYSFKLDPDRDRQIVKGLISGFKRKFCKYAPIIDFFDVREIISNQILVTHESLNEYMPHKKGMKLTKFFSEYFEDEKFDIEFSKVIQAREMQSVIHISINPMDYITSSITKHGWKSCHSMIDGMCGGGCLSYMFDKGTLVAFMASDSMYLYDLCGNNKPFSWNSKLWRQLIYSNYLDNDFVFCREYPQNYNNNSVAEKVRNMLEECVSGFTETPNKWVISKNGARKGGIYKNCKGSAHYDDVPSRETVLIKYKGHKTIENLIVTGSQPVCIFTGDKLDYSVIDKRMIVSPRAFER